MLCKAATIITTVVFIIGIAAYLTIPFWVEGYIRWRNVTSPDYYTIILCTLYPSGLGCLILLYCVLRLLRNINHNRAFVLQNVKLLKIISLCCLIIALIFFCSVFLIDSIFSFIIVLAFAMAALLFYVIGESFRVATKYKEENDLTI